MLRGLFFLFLFIAALLSCRGVKTIASNPTASNDENKSHILAIFMDGTMDKPHPNNKWRNTNLKKMHSLTHENIRSLYVEGVGAGSRLIDATFAFTTKERVMTAYQYLTENYNQGDSICLFGFSRGANQCRILSSFIYTVGIINLNSVEKSARLPLLKNLYELYIRATDVSDKRARLTTFLKNQGLDCDTSGTTMIELMGLWDTVEAFQLDKKEIPTPVNRHLNQLYNVKKLFHAVSLDDNRAFVYTPILATHKDVGLNPRQNIDSIVEEVWFNGSHKNVGGGVRIQIRDSLTGISLNWMLSRLATYQMFEIYKPVFYPYSKVNNMRGDPIGRLTSRGDCLRSIDKYQEAMNPNWNDHRIKLHQSVIDRLDSGIVQRFKLKHKKKTRLDWYDWERFKNCFETDPKNDKRRIFKNNCPCIEVVNDSAAIKKLQL